MNGGRFTQHLLPILCGNRDLPILSGNMPQVLLAFLEVTWNADDSRCQAEQPLLGSLKLELSDLASPPVPLSEFNM